MGNRLVYLAFIILGVAVATLYGRDTPLFHLFVLPADGGRVGDIVETDLVIARQIVIIALFLLFMWSVATYAPRWRASGSAEFLLVPGALALLNVSVIVGERRSAQVLTGVSATVILVSAFPAYKKRIVAAIATTAGAILALMTLYKSFAVFEAGSYTAAADSAGITFQWWAQTLQGYFAGPQVLAATLEMHGAMIQSGASATYDLARSAVPLSFFYKNEGQLSSVIFNRQVYGGAQDTGHVLSATAWGHLHFGSIGYLVAPLSNIAIAYGLERLIYRARSLETLYLWTFIFMRYALNIAANPPSLVSGATIMMATAGTLFAVAIAFRLNRLKGS